MTWLRASIVAALCASVVQASILPTTIRFDTVESPPKQPSDRQRPLEKRQRADGRCGHNYGGASCASDECCSAAGWCGTGYTYCSGPACQINYGPMCDGNIRPPGADTERTPRPKKGRIPYGEGIYSCSRPGAIALTFDDGPFEYTEHLLGLLKEYDVRATFFVTGNSLGKGRLNDHSYPWRGLVARMLDAGHQIASHTWSHQRLTELTQSQLRHQMIYNEIAIADIIGRFPTYMRPPYSASNDATDRWLGDLGYHVTYFDLDTEGYLHNSGAEIQASKRIWDAAVTNSNKDPKQISYLHIEHDIVYQTVYNLTEYMLSSMKAKGIKGVTVGECLNDPQENWYRFVSEGGNDSGGGGGGGGGGDGNDGGVKPLPGTKDGRCGPDHGGQTCEFEAGATCCSGKGWCGATKDHCGVACQPVYGTCG